MKISIEVDVEGILREEIRKHLEERAKMFDDAMSGTDRTATSVAAKFDTPPVTKTDVVKEVAAAEGATVTEITSKASEKPSEPVKWEYSPKPGRRRKKDEIALHEAELNAERLLTKEEKAEILGTKDHTDAEDKQARAKAATKARIDKLAKEAEEQAKAELAAEKAAETPEATEDENTPKQVDDLKDINSLFS